MKDLKLEIKDLELKLRHAENKLTKSEDYYQRMLDDINSKHMHE